MAPPSVLAEIATEQQKVTAEIRELDLLVESTQTEVNRLKSREDQMKAKVEEIRRNPGNFQREEIFATAQRQLAEYTAPPLPPDTTPLIDESRLLQAVVDTQEEERKRIARQVHDGPAQAMANVVLQSEISERLFDVDVQKSRGELAALRQMVNKTLQELRAFIFELRPMILDDLGLVPTMRRYVQTLIDKHGIRIDFSSTGRDRRLPSDDEVAIFRLIQDSLVERIEKGDAKDVVLGMIWKDEQLDILLQSDGKDLPSDGELASGLRRSERLELLKGESTHEARADGTVVLQVKLPIRAATAMIT